MKKTILIITSTLLLFSCGIFQQNKAVEYNNSLIIEQEKVADKMNSFIEMATSGDSLSETEVLTKRKEIIDFINNSMKKVEDIGDFENSSFFKESILNVMNVYKEGIENEYTKMAKYTVLPIEEQTPDKYIETMKLAYTADSLISKAENEFIEAQIVFANEQNLELEPAPEF
ncbi:MAG: LIC11966 family surface protein [Flavobacteriales bacterium]